MRLSTIKQEISWNKYNINMKQIYAEQYIDENHTRMWEN